VALTHLLRQFDDQCAHFETQEVDHLALVESVHEVAIGTRVWLQQSWEEREARRKADYVAEPNWHWDSGQQQFVEQQASTIQSSAKAKRKGRDLVWAFNAPEFCAKSMVCTILDAFPTRLRWTGNQVEDACDPHLLFGIRPALMAMLRRDVMLKRDVRLCIRPSCGKYFTASRLNRMCCSRDCTVKLNNARQYPKTKMRRQRAAADRKRKKR
jgi:hypothetical protein